ncbi:MAG: hypothetical protein HDR13_12360 [Lachnospiraceae bacterium]|nr:hypothetical protein [Lachnospiraceae bacterium]
MVVDYKARKNEVISSYDKLEELVSDLQKYAKTINMPDPLERMDNLMTDIRGKAERVKADRFNIIIAGESKSGKSTFVNAYLGVELLPMDVKQCTSAIVKIKYGNAFSVRATYADGRHEEITGDDDARAFLKKNAALDDDYRDIPVPTINSEILVKSGLRAREKGAMISISDAEVKKMLESPEVKVANIHNIPNYNEKIRDYIESRKNTWQDIVTKIEVMFPFGEDLRGIEIIDSPGVCARGGVSDITSDYIENADAIIFLKPVIGQALESEQFNQFMENVSVARNKNALFLVLTHIATKNEADIRRLEEDAYKKFSAKLDKNNILFVDSKAELYAKKFVNVENVEDELRRLNSEGTLDDFVTKAYTETNGLFGNGDMGDFIRKLQEKSRFDQIYYSLETFGRKAHYILLAALLDSINSAYEKLWNDMNSRIDMFRQKAEDPNELAKKIAKVKQDLDIIQNKLSRGVDGVVRRFRGDEGIIKTDAESAVKDFLENVTKIDPNSSEAFNKLESISVKKIDQFKELTERLQHQVVEEFDKELIALSDKSEIPFESLKPDFTEETFKKIKESTKSKAEETRSYEEGITFKKSHSYSVYVRDKHFEIIKNDILGRLDVLKNDLISNLEDFVENIRTKYIDELAKNAGAKKDELDAIMEAKITAEQNQIIIKKLSDQAGGIKAEQTVVKKLKGGISKYVQHIN